jgi:hypothetical protein
MPGPRRMGSQPLYFPLAHIYQSTHVRVRKLAGPPTRVVGVVSKQSVTEKTSTPKALPDEDGNLAAALGVRVL